MSMKPPLFFRGPNGDWDVSVFRDESHAVAYCEAIDVVNGEYGEYGWDASGLLVKLIVEPRSRGVLSFLAPEGKVRVHWLKEEAARPDELRRVLLRFLSHRAEHRGSDAPSLEPVSLESLVAVMWRHLTP
ncbi:MAG TPA: hypothetical protein VK034_28600 [Enhygromyxa sp.]|nr:hypothetical protein [Enhygromyxa sp.]